MPCVRRLRALTPIGLVGACPRGRSEANWTVPHTTHLSTTRRKLILGAAGLGATWLVADQLGVLDALTHARAVVDKGTPQPTAILTAGESAVLAAIAARIVPTTETPGATEAGVIHFIDRALGTFEQESLGDIRAGIADLARRSKEKLSTAQSFADLGPADQDAVLQAIEEEEFFGQVRYLTMVGMFANPSWGGNKDGMGWKNIGFEPKAAHQPPFGYYDTPANMEG